VTWKFSQAAILGRRSGSHKEYSIKRCFGSFVLLTKLVYAGDYLLIALVGIYDCLNGSELIPDSLRDRSGIGSLLVGEVRLTQCGIVTPDQTRIAYAQIISSLTIDWRRCEFSSTLHYGPLCCGQSSETLRVDERVTDVPICRRLETGSPSGSL
jgi:hypothetical protein